MSVDGKPPVAGRRREVELGEVGAQLVPPTIMTSTPRRLLADLASSPGTMRCPTCRPCTSLAGPATPRSTLTADTPWAAAGRTGARQAAAMSASPGRPLAARRPTSTPAQDDGTSLESRRAVTGLRARRAGRSPSSSPAAPGVNRARRRLWPHAPSACRRTREYGRQPHLLLAGLALTDSSLPPSVRCWSGMAPRAVALPKRTGRLARPPIVLTRLRADLVLPPRLPVRGPLSLSRVADVLGQSCRALHVARRRAAHG